MDRVLKPLHGVDEFEQVLVESQTLPLLLFKHSHTCGISMDALDELHAHLRAADARARYVMVTVQTHRHVSNAITARLGLRHETPQAILVVDGRPVWSASHFSVTADEIARAIRNVTESA